MYHNVFRYEYLTFQTRIHLHKQYIFETNIIQSEYAFLFPFSILKKLLEVVSKDYHNKSISKVKFKKTFKSGFKKTFQHKH